MRYLILSKVNNQVKHTYSIADSVYQSNLSIDVLTSYCISNSNNVADTKAAIPNYSISSNLFQDCAHIGENAYDLCVDTIEPTGYLLKTKKQSYQLNINTIQCNSHCVDNTLLLGPVLILNLAMNKVFCMHASAFMLKGKVFILMGDSGTGKSTIARFMENQPDAKRLSDDILPLKIVDGNLTIYANFPQLKLSNNKQYNGNNIVGETILLFAQKSNNETGLTLVNTFDAIKYLIKHTVATKLFAKKELQNHLFFCHQTCSKAKTYRLNYQHSSQSLDQLYNLLNEIN